MTRSWTCSRCEVTARFAPGHEPAGDLPSGWAEQDGELACLGCRRELAAEAAVAAAGLDPERDPTGRVRQRALVEFELRRDPSRSDAEIAKTARAARTTVAMIRRELLARGEIERRLPPRPKPLGPRACEHCGAEFIPGKPWARYCSQRCGTRGRAARRAAA